MRSKELRRKGVGADVVSKDLDVRRVYLAQKPQLEVRGDHASGGANDIRQPAGDRPSPPTDLQTPSAPADSKALDAPLRKRVEMLLQQLKTARFVLGGMRERVVWRLTHDQNRKPGSLRRRGAAPRRDGFGHQLGACPHVRERGGAPTYLTGALPWNRRRSPRLPRRRHCRCLTASGSLPRISPEGEPRSPIVDAGTLHMHRRPRAASSRRHARFWVAREASARHGVCAAPTRRGLPTSAIRWRQASGGVPYIVEAIVSFGPGWRSLPWPRRRRTRGGRGPLSSGEAKAAWAQCGWC